MTVISSPPCAIVSECAFRFSDGATYRIISNQTPASKLHAASLSSSCASCLPSLAPFFTTSCSDFSVSNATICSCASAPPRLAMARTRMESLLTASYKLLLHLSSSGRSSWQQATRYAQYRDK
ncbi:hypothetical protein E2562_007348 [Oryza meyeriana var. granulata]|uniref:Uncharacterized protein n=1 Tax=Oryza meyeriana var. granulata TaxID=110450 RepID=A0A6G1CZH7_9ORYZ|nr:hypothetical protein E2562_007348 [Oryza meyeriana var. granulata]